MTQTTRATQTLDATGQAPGRLATRIAMMLMGKDKPAFVNNVDAGAKVEVINASKMAIKGTKMDTKLYHSHTGAPGGFKTKNLATLWAENPAEVLRRAVSRMLPKNSFRQARVKRLDIKN